jgi:hypothetical protein
MEKKNPAIRGRAEKQGENKRKTEIDRTTGMARRQRAGRDSG